MEKKDAPRPLDAVKETRGAQDLLLETSGRCMALEFAIRVLIDTHPDAAKIAATWRARSDELIEAAMQSPIYTQNASYNKGMNTTLGRLALFLQD